MTHGRLLHVERAVGRLRGALLAQRTPDGGFRGELSSSALATAVAILALATVDADTHREEIARGAAWLAGHVNADGGFGDTPACPSNVSTTVLVWSALTCAHVDCDSAVRWIRREVGSLAPLPLAAALSARYGEDRTFSAPILAAAAIAGTLGARPECWRLVPQLPFELAVLPHRVLKWLRLPVVSYALPALIAIGLARHEFEPSPWPWMRGLRARVSSRVLERLEGVQPESGGFLEAAPLTGFVAASLAACGFGQTRAVARCCTFLKAGQRADGSWPIDSDLATWTTTLSVKALAASGRVPADLRQSLRGWLLRRQHERPHPFTQAAPGGFAWTDLSGGVPDADDTAGALLALDALGARDPESVRAASRGVRWLLALQNGDGGVPTFCRGWGRMPFDRSCPEITAHAMRAVQAWQPHLGLAERRAADRFRSRARRFLLSTQRPEGSWRPLWFGNPWREDRANDVYGTAQVLMALKGGQESSATGEAAVARALGWLANARNPDGGWGRDARGGSTVEETGLAVASLAGRVPIDVVTDGALWLAERVEADALEPAPIGLYFSSLWYSERLYPIVFGLLGLSAYLEEARGTARAEAAA